MIIELTVQQDDNILTVESDENDMLTVGADDTYIMVEEE